MLEKQLRREPYSKAEHRRTLTRLLSNRSDASIERKHQNISAILIEARFPYINGYKPLSNYQSLLADVVLDRLYDDAVLGQLALDFVEAPVSFPPGANILDRMTDRPQPLDTARSAVEQMTRAKTGRVDYLAREARNSALGAEGERFVVAYERARLAALGLGNLAARVEHVSVTQGDGAGFDVRSYDRDGQEKFIEVKTTQLGILTPFYISARELSFSSQQADHYALYRVFDFSSDPRMFSLSGSVSDTCALRVTQYSARPSL